MKTRLLGAATLCAALVLAAVPQAGSAAPNLTDSITLSASVVNTCQIAVSNTVLGFGTYDPVVANAVAGAGDISLPYTASYTCTKGDTTSSIAFKDSGASTTTCALKSGSNTLSYTISDGSNTDYCTSASHHYATGSGTSQTQTYTFDLYGGQNVPAGSYSDVKLATIAP